MDTGFDFGALVAFESPSENLLLAGDRGYGDPGAGDTVDMSRVPDELTLLCPGADLALVIDPPSPPSTLLTVVGDSASPTSFELPTDALNLLYSPLMPPCTSSPAKLRLSDAAEARGGGAYSAKVVRLPVCEAFVWMWSSVDARASLLCSRRDEFEVTEPRRSRACCM